jgi:hypothetical protein
MSIAQLLFDSSYEIDVKIRSDKPILRYQRALYVLSGLRWAKMIIASDKHHTSQSDEYVLSLPRKNDKYFGKPKYNASQSDEYGRSLPR